MAQLNLRAELYRALTRQHGIVLATDDPKRLIEKLQAERRECGDPVLKRIIIAQSRKDPEHEVWLILKPEEPAVAEEDRPAPGGGDDQAV